jgi:hypothetical protein
MWLPSEVFRASRSPVSDDLLLGYRRTETEERGATEERGPGVFSPRRIFRWRRKMDVSVPPSLIAFYENRQCRTDSPSARQSTSKATGIRHVAASPRTKDTGPPTPAGATLSCHEIFGGSKVDDLFGPFRNVLFN